MPSEIFCLELKEKIALGENIILLDVRTREEHDFAAINPSILIPLDELELRYLELDKNKEIIIYCHHGVRSKVAAQFLFSKGFTVKSLHSGIDAWSLQIDTTLPRY